MKEENENKIKLIDKIKGFIIKRKSILLIIFESSATNIFFFIMYSPILNIFWQFL